MSELASYSNPPVVETAMALQFRPLKGFKNVHLWGYWSEIRDQYPETHDSEPVDSRAEVFGGGFRFGPHLPKIRFRPHASRLQALSADGHKMIQIQNGRFIFNWRRLEGGLYPRWETNWPEFRARFEQFERHIESEGLGKVVPDQWEVTYVNHLMRGEDWNTEDDWRRMLPGILGNCSDVGGGRLEAVECCMQYVLKAESGRLYVELKKAVMAGDPDQELLVLTLTARGGVTPECSGEEGLVKGRQAIVTCFSEVTGQEAQERWGRTA